jgi:hypothetical protein
MNQPIYPDVPRINVTQYGSALIEGQVIPCCVGRDLMIYVPVIGVCEAIGIPFEAEIERISNLHALYQGLVITPFRIRNQENGELETHEVAAISFTRLHTWLSSIPTDQVENEEMRGRLVAMQEHLADLIYAYMGRPLVPEELRQTQERSLGEEQQQFYASIEQVAKVQGQLSVTDEKLEKVANRVKLLEVSLSLSAPGSVFIDKKQQEIYRAMIGIVGKLYEQKGRGKFEDIEANLKKDFDFTFYKVIKSEQWESIVRSLTQTYKALVPAGTPVPQIFQDAAKLKTQSSVKQPGLF